MPHLAEPLGQGAELLGQMDARDNGKPFNEPSKPYAYPAQHWRYFARLTSNRSLRQSRASVMKHDNMVHT